MDDRSSSSEESVRTRIREKEVQVLMELSATLNTLTSLYEVLDDIVTLTEPVVQSTAPPPQDKHKMANVAVKQQKLLDELQQWQSISDDGSTK
jgi:uncharacterized protein YerC